MKKLYEKSEITFAILWIVIYTVVTGTLKSKFGFDSLWPMLFLIVLSAALLLFVKRNGLMEKYGTAIDRESAYEQIQGQRDVAAANAQLAAERAAFEKERAEFEAKRQKEAERAAKEQQKAEEKAAREAERQAARAEAAAQKQAEREAREREKAQQEVAKQVGRVATSMIGSFGREVTRQLARGLMGSLRR